MKNKIIWRPIKNYGNLYKVNNIGEIKNIKTNKILKASKSINGYLSVKLSKNGKIKQFYIHRLVIYAFKPISTNKTLVNHINGIKSDNRIDNLEWCTSKENSIHAFNTGLRNKKNIKHTIINQYDIDGKFIKEWDSITNASKSLCIAQGSISACCQGKRKTAGKFMWTTANNRRKKL